MTLRGRRRLAVLGAWMAVAAAAALAAGWSGSDPPRRGLSRPELPRPAAAERAGERAPDAGRTGETERARELAAILGRPLFAPDRRPAAAAAGGGNGTFRLVGTVVEARGARRALLAPPGGGPVLVVREGAVAGPLVIRRIEAGRVLAERNAAAVLLVLGHGGAGPRDAAPAPFVPAPEMTKDPRSRAANNQDE